MAKRVVLVGLDPDVVDFSDPFYAAFPGLNVEVLRASLEKGGAALGALGYDVAWSHWDGSEGAEARLVADLRAHAPDGVVIGAGVRLNPRLTELFERLVNLVRQHAPEARLCFNAGPTDLPAAVARQLG